MNSLSVIMWNHPTPDFIGFASLHFINSKEVRGRVISRYWVNITQYLTYFIAQIQKRKYTQYLLTWLYGVTKSSSGTRGSSKAFNRRTGILICKHQRRDKHKKGKQTSKTKEKHKTILPQDCSNSCLLGAQETYNKRSFRKVETYHELPCHLAIRT